MKVLLINMFRSDVRVFSFVVMMLIGMSSSIMASEFSANGDFSKVNSNGGVNVSGSTVGDVSRVRVFVNEENYFTTKVENERFNVNIPTGYYTTDGPILSYQVDTGGAFSERLPLYSNVELDQSVIAGGDKISLTGSSDSALKITRTDVLYDATAHGDLSVVEQNGAVTVAGAVMGNDSGEAERIRLYLEDNMYYTMNLVEGGFSRVFSAAALKDKNFDLSYELLFDNYKSAKVPLKVSSPINSSVVVDGYTYYIATDSKNQLSIGGKVDFASGEVNADSTRLYGDGDVNISGSASNVGDATKIRVYVSDNAYYTKTIVDGTFDVKVDQSLLYDQNYGVEYQLFFEDNTKSERMDLNTSVAIDEQLTDNEYRSYVHSTVDGQLFIGAESVDVSDAVVDVSGSVINSDGSLAIKGSITGVPSGVVTHVRVYLDSFNFVDLVVNDNKFVGELDVPNQVSVYELSYGLSNDYQASFSKPKHVSSVEAIDSEQVVTGVKKRLYSVTTGVDLSVDKIDASVINVDALASNVTSDGSVNIGGTVTGEDAEYITNMLIYLDADTYYAASTSGNSFSASVDQSVLEDCEFELEYRISVDGGLTYTDLMPLTSSVSYDESVVVNGYDSYLKSNSLNQVVIGASKLDSDISLTGEDAIINVGDSYSSESAGLHNVVAVDESGNDISSEVIVSDLQSVDTSNPGVYPVTLSVTGESSTVTLPVNVVVVNDGVVIDNESPYVYVSSITVLKDSVYSKDLLDYFSYDRQDFDLTSQVVISDDNVDTAVIGDYQVTASVVDKAGNSSSAIGVVKVISGDDVAPVISGNSEVELDKGSVLDFNDNDAVGITASDNNDGDVSDSIIVKSNVNGFVGDGSDVVGSYPIGYVATDNSGNESLEFVVTINVIEPVFVPDAIVVDSCKNLESIGRGANYAGASHTDAWPINGKYQLLSDIDCTESSDASMYGENGFDEIATGGFSGTFYGNGYTIKNLYIAKREDTGLFDNITKSGVVKDLNLTNARLVNGGVGVGLLVDENYGVIDNVHVQGSVQGSVYVGGLAAVNWGDYDNTGIYNSSADVDVSCYQWCGGLIGKNDDTVSNSYTSGTINVNGGLGDGIGGVIGHSDRGDLRDLGSDVDITVNIQGGYIGGLIGNTVTGSVENSFSNGDITSTSDQGHVGGAIGRNQNATIKNSYATGNISLPNDSRDVGGFAGGNYGKELRSVYALGDVAGGYRTGSLVGQNKVGVINSVGTGSVTGRTDSGGAIGKNYGTGVVNTYYGDWNTDGNGTPISLLMLQSKDFWSSSLMFDAVSFDLDMVTAGQYPHVRSISGEKLDNQVLFDIVE